jgi:beta-N-acetylhexosaminidase
MQRSIVPAGILFLAVAVLLAGGHGATAQADGKVDIRGNITRVNKLNEGQKGQGILAVVLIEGKQEPNTGYEKAVVKITQKTKLWKQAGDKKKPAMATELKVGTRVEAVFTGPVAESFPVQATAGEVVILPAKE